MPRRFGPTQGAGVVVVEQDGDRGINPAPTGIICYVGVTEKGDVGQLIHCPSKSDFVKKCGGYLDGNVSQLPDSIYDFFNLGTGAGEAFIVRVTDGTEVRALEQAFGRQIGSGYYAGRLVDSTFSEVKVPLLTVSAKNGGRWGGRERVVTGQITVPGSATSPLTQTVLSTGATMLADELKGGKLYLKGVTTKSYVIKGNTTSGLITVESDSTMFTDLTGGSTPAQGDWWAVLNTEELAWPTALAGTKKGLDVLWKDGEEDEDALFGMEIYENRVKVADYPNLSMDPANKWYIDTVVNGANDGEGDNWVSISVEYTDTVTADHRPANWYGAAKEWASDTVIVDICHVKSITSANAEAGWIGNWSMPADAGYADKVVRQRIILTFTSSSAFNVTTSATYGAKQLNLPAGTVGTAWASDNPYTPGFKVLAGSGGWTAGDVITIDVIPLLVSDDGEGQLAGQWLYYNIGASKRSRLKISSNTSNSVTLSAAPATTPDEALGATGYLATGALSFPLTVTSTPLVIHHSTFGKFSAALNAGSPYADMAALTAAINTAWQAFTGGLGNIATASGAVLRLGMDDSGSDTEVGYESFLKFKSGPAALTFTASASIVGTLGSEFRIQGLTELRGGHSGGAPTNANYTQHADTTDSVINRIFGRNKGLVKLATPGVTTTAIQQAFVAYAAARNYQFRVEFAPNLDDDSAAVAFINDTLGRDDFAVCSYPSYGYVANPMGNGIVLRTLTGAIHGREALVARNYEGYHKAAAGIDVTLPNVIRLPTGARMLNEELLNPVGINVIKKSRGKFIVWGDRTIALDPTWKWKHQREYMSHIENIFREEFDYIIFAINDDVTQLSLVTTFRAFFTPEWKKRALRGARFEDAVLIKIDSENNTNLTRADGNLFADIRLRLADTVERFVIRIGKAGIFEDLA